MKKVNKKLSIIIGLLVLVLGIVTLAMILFMQPSGLPPERTSLDDHPPRMVSAFFGLDNAIPLRAALLSISAPGKDGMPVTFSRRVDGPIDPAAFTVTTRSGIQYQPSVATTRPANDIDQLHTVLLIGDLGDEPDDPPVKVEVTGHLLLAGGMDAHGLSVAVTPLADGPSLVLAYTTQPGKIEGNYPADTRQIIVVVWNGGVRPTPGVTIEDRRLGYSVTTTEGDVAPIALGRLDDGDNYEHLYLDTSASPLRVSMKGGLLMDPRADPNPATSVEFVRPMQP